jgi:hypothetical protein
MSEILGASKSLRKNIKRIRSLVSKKLRPSKSPRKDYNDHFDALVKEAFKRGFRAAHKQIFNMNPSYPLSLELTFKGKLPAFRGKQKVKFSSRNGKK